MLVIHSQKKRRAIRRAVFAPCVAVATSGYRLIGHRVLDLSPRGMLVTCGTEVQIGDDVFVSFRPPGDGKWMNAKAEVSRIVLGSRPWDVGPCVGLVLKDLDYSERGELLTRLAGIPPTVPRRPLRLSAGMYTAQSSPAIPLVRRRPITVPQGVWTAAPLARAQY
ncbi:MAG: PilZ domain-containing protein [Deltaproteobacteria bacterium]|nr:PilZ domain-containing protein [Deltaproteobacteria bacterium]